MNKHLAIVGSHRDTRELAPWDDTTIDIWVFNEAASQQIKRPDGAVESWVKRVDGVFQLHDPVVYKSEHNRSDRYHWDWLRQYHPGLTIFMQEADPEVPNAVRLPIEGLYDLLANITQGLPAEPVKYFTSTVAIAIALAIYEGYEQIDLYGVDMASETEYFYQRECVGFWIGYAVGAGIKVHAISGRDMLVRPVYGYEGYIEAKPEDFQTRAAEIRAQVAEWKAKARQGEDALEDSYRDFGAHHNDLITQTGEAEYQLGYHEGILTEVERYAYKIAGMLAEGNTFAFIDRNEYELTAAQANRDQLQLGPLMFRTAGHVDLTLATWHTTHNPVHLEQLRRFVREHLDAAYNSGKAQGIYDENRRLSDELDQRIRAAGGKKTVEVLRLEKANGRTTPA